MRSFIDVLRGNAWWIAPEVLLTVGLAAGGLYYNAVAPRLSEPELHARATQLLAVELEQATVDEHAKHGHQLSAQDRMLCEVEVFGVDPAGEGRERHLRTAYGYYLCAAGKPGTPFLGALMNAGPAVLHLDAEPGDDRVQTVTLQQDFDAQLAAMMPERYRAQASKGFTTADPPRALKERFEREITNVA
ncbi:hypothetical protein J2S43_004146 [Catenuloplanes nepalensis]|uniref:Uncharacterized protein n=1 Tax=Catenuloplanes nepalensis TaxID=587533 RepID=A0ABT9MW74_9ACTN|nr:hypothetical protein [Catenuloplanes nepalensis]MDP9795634.1 hypothetical protein [Catenuloplanes nepalensis]